MWGEIFPLKICLPTLRFREICGKTLLVLIMKRGKRIEKRGMRGVLCRLDSWACFSPSSNLIGKRRREMTGVSRECLVASIWLNIYRLRDRSRVRGYETRVRMCGVRVRDFG